MSSQATSSVSSELAPSKSGVRRTEVNITRTDPTRAAIIRRGEITVMDFAEACAYLGGISPATLRRQINARRITCVRLGGRLLFRKTDLDRDLTKLAVPAL